MTPFQDLLDQANELRQRIADLERQVAALTQSLENMTGANMLNANALRLNKEKLAAAQEQITALTKERDEIERLMNMAAVNADKYYEQLTAAQAVNEKLREEFSLIFKFANSKPVRDAAAEALALPSDDSALQARLKEEREKCCQAVHHDECVEAIRGMK